VSWQIVPTVLGGMMKDADRTRAGRVMEAMLQMKKLDIAGLEQAHAMASFREAAPARSPASRREPGGMP